MKAMPFDDNKFGGDHEFYAPGAEVDYNDGDSFETLVARVDANRFEGFNEEELAEEKEYETKVTGFWLIQDADLETISAVWPDDGCRNDTATYVCNAAAKRICSRLAFAELTSEGITTS